MSVACSNGVVIIELTRFGRNASCKFYGSGPLFWENRMSVRVSFGAVRL